MSNAKMTFNRLRCPLIVVSHKRIRFSSADLSSYTSPEIHAFNLFEIFIPFPISYYPFVAS